MSKANNKNGGTNRARGSTFSLAPFVSRSGRSQTALLFYSTRLIPSRRTSLLVPPTGLLASHSRRSPTLQPFGRPFPRNRLTPPRPVSRPQSGRSPLPLPVPKPILIHLPRRIAPFCPPPTKPAGTSGRRRPTKYTSVVPPRKANRQPQPFFRPTQSGRRQLPKTGQDPAVFLVASRRQTHGQRPCLQQSRSKRSSVPPLVRARALKRRSSGIQVMPSAMPSASRRSPPRPQVEPFVIQSRRTIRLVQRPLPAGKTSKRSAVCPAWTVTPRRRQSMQIPPLSRASGRRPVPRLALNPLAFVAPGKRKGIAKTTPPSTGLAEWRGIPPTGWGAAPLTALVRRVARPQMPVEIRPGVKRRVLGIGLSAVPSVCALEARRYRPAPAPPEELLRVRTSRSWYPGLSRAGLAVVGPLSIEAGAVWFAGVLAGDIVEEGR